MADKPFTTDDSAPNFLKTPPRPKPAAETTAGKSAGPTTTRPSAYDSSGSQFTDFTRTKLKDQPLSTPTAAVRPTPTPVTNRVAPGGPPAAAAPGAGRSSGGGGFHPIAAVKRLFGIGGGRPKLGGSSALSPGPTAETALPAARKSTAEAAPTPALGADYKPSPVKTADAGEPPPPYGTAWGDEQKATTPREKAQGIRKRRASAEPTFGVDTSVGAGILRKAKKPVAGQDFGVDTSVGAGILRKAKPGAAPATGPARRMTATDYPSGLVNEGRKMTATDYPSGILKESEPAHSAWGYPAGGAQARTPNAAPAAETATKPTSLPDFRRNTNNFDINRGGEQGRPKPVSGRGAALAARAQSKNRNYRGGGGTSTELPPPRNMTNAEYGHRALHPGKMSNADLIRSGVLKH